MEENKEKNVKKKAFTKKNKIAIIIMVVMIIALLVSNAYATNNGYTNIFFMIKDMITNQSLEINGKDNLLSDRDITISYSPIEITDGLKIQVQRVVLENNSATLYIYVNESSENTKLPLKYKIYNNDGKLIADYNGNSTPSLDKVQINTKVKEDESLKLEIYDNSGKLLSTITIDLKNKELLVNGEKVEIKKQSEVELKKYLGVFCLLSNNDPNFEHSLDNDNGKIIYIARQLNSEILHKEENSKRELINKIIEAFYYKDIEKENDIIKTNIYEYDKEKDEYLPMGVTFGGGNCLEITDISYENEIYTVEFIYCITGDIPPFTDISSQPQYKAVAKLKVNENEEYSKYKLVSISEGTLVKERVQNQFEGNAENIIGEWYKNENADYARIKNINATGIEFDWFIYRMDNYENIWANFSGDNKAIFISKNDLGTHEIEGEIEYNNGKITVKITKVTDPSTTSIKEGYTITFDKKKNIKNEEVSKKDNSEIYSSIIDEYKKAIADSSVGEDELTEKYPNVNDLMMWYYHIYNQNDKFYYTYYNINNKDDDELIILKKAANSDKYTIIDVFYCMDNKPTKLIGALNLGDRSNVEIYTNGTLYLHGSSSASTGILSFYEVGSQDKGWAGHTTIYYEYDNNGKVSFRGLMYSSIEEIVAEYTKNSSPISLDKLNLVELN